jgi:hypothetical protein
MKNSDERRTILSMLFMLLVCGSMGGVLIDFDESFRDGVYLTLRVLSGILVAYASVSFWLFLIERKK